MLHCYVYMYIACLVIFCNVHLYQYVFCTCMLCCNNNLFTLHPSTSYLLPSLMFIGFYNRVCYVLPPFTYFTVKYFLYVYFFMLLFSKFLWMTSNKYLWLSTEGRMTSLLHNVLNQKPQIALAMNRWQRKIPFFWDLLPCQLVFSDVLEECAASNCRV
jgi:hypothetical protein